MESILVVIHLLLAIGLVGLVLIQHGKGADMGAAFGSGASATVFGSAGAGSFLSRTTGILAALFFLTSLALAWFAMQKGEKESLIKAEQQPAPAVVVQKKPAAPAQSDLPPVPEAPKAQPASDVPSVPAAPAAGAPASDVPAVPAADAGKAPAPEPAK